MSTFSNYEYKPSNILKLLRGVLAQGVPVLHLDLICPDLFEFHEQGVPDGDGFIDQMQVLGEHCVHFNAPQIFLE